MATVTVKKTRTATKSAAAKQPEKKKISKFGQMRGIYKGLIVEHGNVWNL